MFKEKLGKSRLLQERQVVRARLSSIEVSPEVRAELKDQEKTVVEVVHSVQAEFLRQAQQAGDKVPRRDLFRLGLNSVIESFTNYQALADPGIHFKDFLVQVSSGQTVLRRVESQEYFQDTGNMVDLTQQTAEQSFRGVVPNPRWPDTIPLISSEDIELYLNQLPEPNTDVDSFLYHVRQARLADVYSPVWVVKGDQVKKVQSEKGKLLLDGFHRLLIAFMLKRPSYVVELTLDSKSR